MLQKALISYLEKKIIQKVNEKDLVIIGIDGPTASGKTILANELAKNILSIKGVRGIFLYEDFLSVNKITSIDWTDIKHIVISYINDFYAKGNDSIISADKNKNQNKNFSEIEKKIVDILETKIRPAVSRDGGDIVLSSFKNGVVTVKLKGSCSGCPSSTLTLKKGVENLLTHYIPEVKEVISI